MFSSVFRTPGSGYVLFDNNSFLVVQEFGSGFYVLGPWGKVQVSLETLSLFSPGLLRPLVPFFDFLPYLTPCWLTSSELVNQFWLTTNWLTNSVLVNQLSFG